MRTAGSPGAASSHDVDDAGIIRPIHASVPDDGTAACWLAVTTDGRAAPTPNAGWANVIECTIDADPERSLAGDGPNGEPTQAAPTSTCPTVTVACTCCTAVP